MRSRRRVAAWLVVSAALVAGAGAGCARRELAPAERQRELAAYLPLAVGNTWHYERQFLGEEGQHQVQIVDRAEDGFFLDDRGNRLGVDAFGVRDEKRYLLRHPVEAGREWSTIVSVSSVERYQILDVGFRCQVPAGVFEECVRVEGRSRIDPQKWMVNQITFAPGVGMVRFEFFLESAGRRIPQGRMALRSYTLAAGGDAKGQQP
jgi:hypothetical protein